MSTPVAIAGRAVGPGHACFVIAEIGVNHDGSEARAIELVHHAARAGCDAIKLQLFSADRLVQQGAPTAGYQQQRCGATDQAALLRQYELAPPSVRRVVDTARDLGLVPLATPFSLEDVELIESLDLPAIKIASPDLVNRPLLERCAQSGRPMLVSSGAATLEEIDRCLGWLDGHPLVLLHCVSSYPTPPALANLAWITALARRFPSTPIGYSDHCGDALAGPLAVVAGACVIEKHLTYDVRAAGPDHAASVDPLQMADYVRSVRRATMMLGSGERDLLEVEADVRRLSRQSVVTTRAIRAGERVARSDLTVRRPGTGIAAEHLDSLVGTVARRDLAAGAMPREEDFVRPVTTAA